MHRTPNRVRLVSLGPPALASNPLSGEELDGDIAGDQESLVGGKVAASGGVETSPQGY